MKLIPLALALTTFAGFAAAQCDDWPDEKDPVKITLVVVLAREKGEKGDKIDKNLKMLAAEVQKTHPHLKDFTFKTQEARSVKPNEKTTMLCVENQMVEMLVKHGADKDNRVSLQVKPPEMSPLEYQSVCGKYLPIVTRYKTKKGDTLIGCHAVDPELFQCRGHCPFPPRI